MTDEECRPAAVHVAKEHVMPVAGKEHWRWLKVSSYREALVLIASVAKTLVVISMACVRFHGTMDGA